MSNLDIKVGDKVILKKATEPWQFEALEKMCDYSDIENCRQHFFDGRELTVQCVNCCSGAFRVKEDETFFVLSPNWVDTVIKNKSVDSKTNEIKPLHGYEVSLNMGTGEVHIQFEISLKDSEYLLPENAKNVRIVYEVKND